VAGRPFYPLMLSRKVEMAVQRYRVDRNLSMGKALNQLVETGLVTFGYVLDELKCEHRYRWERIRDSGVLIATCLKCNRNPTAEELLAKAVYVEDPIPRDKGIYGPPTTIGSAK